MINKEDFAQFAKDTHLLDFETDMGEASAMALLSPRKARKQPQTPKKGHHVEEDPDEKVHLLPLALLSSNNTLPYASQKKVYFLFLQMQSCAD